MSRLQQGDQSAFSILVDRHVRTLSALAAQMTGDVHVAEDITQAVFLKTWQILPDWETGNAKLVTWMRRVATNMCLDYIRKKKPALMAVLPDVPSDDVTPEESLAKLEKHNQVKAHLEHLPERQKAALTLFYFQELSLRESAEIMDISESAFESLLRRARQNLKQDMLNKEAIK